MTEVAPLRALPKSAVRDASDSIGREIVAGRYAVEGKLPLEAELSEQLGVSRTVLRETTRLLTAKGMVKPVRHFGTAVRHHENWNLLDPDIALWHEIDSPTIDFMREELKALMQAVLPLAALNAARGFEADGFTGDTPDSAEAFIVMIFETANSRVYQNARDLAFHFVRLNKWDDMQAGLFDRLQVAVLAGRADEARSCAELIVS